VNPLPKQWYALPAAPKETQLDTPDAEKLRPFIFARSRNLPLPRCLHLQNRRAKWGGKKTNPRVMADRVGSAADNQNGPHGMEGL